MPIHVRVVATYPAEAGEPEETFDLTYRLRSDFAADAEGAHLRIVAGMELGAEAIGFPVEDDDYVVAFESEVVREVWVW